LKVKIYEERVSVYSTNDFSHNCNSVIDDRYQYKEYVKGIMEKLIGQTMGHLIVFNEKALSCRKSNFIIFVAHHTSSLSNKPVNIHIDRNNVPIFEHLILNSSESITFSHIVIKSNKGGLIWKELAMNSVPINLSDLWLDLMVLFCWCGYNNSL
jgi:hypothetical protein